MSDKTAVQPVGERCAFYTRYSKGPNSLSVEDQIRACREFAQIHGWTEVEAYREQTITGGSSSSTCEEGNR